VGDAIIRTEGLGKSFGDVHALKGIDLEVPQGTVFGLLGPNGAGKTTTVEILEGYRRRDAGDVEVLGTDPAAAGGDWRERIGVVLQSSAMYETLTVTEMLNVFAPAACSSPSRSRPSSGSSPPPF
jgi:ABC-2 type transport system ATP-binding protein